VSAIADQQIKPDDRLARANALRLAAAQALASSSSIVIMTTGAIVGSILAPSPVYATAPVSVYVVGTAASALPVGYIARRYGRMATFYLGTSAGVLVSILASSAIYIGSFALFCVATFIGGFFQAVTQSFRFAATDTASPAFRPKAISWVMAGGVFAGVLGPQLVNLTMELWQPYLFMMSFAAQGVTALICMAVLSGTSLPKPAAVIDAPGGRPLREIVRQPRFIAAVLSGIVSYAMMNLLMTSAPLAMKLCGLSLSDANWGIQWHVIAMFLPSFWTGTLIQKFGAPRIVIFGLLLIVAAALVNLQGLTVAHFWTGLVLLGVGWNFGFIGASSLVVETHRPEERNRVQSFNDFLVFGSMAVGSFASGKLLADSGWGAVNQIVFPLVAVALVVLLLMGRWREKAAS
jgi:predicted MFS family arabinose efflux permease